MVILIPAVILPLLALLLTIARKWLARYPQDASVMAYIGRSGWNSLRIGGAIPDDELFEAIDASYEAVVSKLPRKDRPAAS